MYLSKSFIPILKNNPSEAKIKSHQLMLRVGMIKQASAGIYSWLPLGFKVMKKIEAIVRQEQNKIGAQEILMPTIQPSDIWKESGRYDDYGDEMLRIKDRQGREMLYGPTNEELVTDIFRSSVKSYKSLPQLLYHIQWKFRDEVRPRFGIMRGREFYMKDAYSFDVNDEDATFSYNKFFFSYLKTFKRLELSAIPMAADTGPIGGNLSHEFIILADTGESKIFTDKRVFDLGSEGTVLDRQSLQDLRKKYEQYYAVADEKFNKNEFEEKVSEENRLITKGIEELRHGLYAHERLERELKILSKIAEMHHLKSFFDELVKNTKRYKKKEPLTGNAISPKTLFIEAAPFGINNIFENLMKTNNFEGLVYLLKIVDEVYLFRNGHWQFVQKYIMANTKYAMATGGTPITSWIPNQILSVIRQMEDVVTAINEIGKSDQEEANAIFEHNMKLLPTKKGLINGQLELIHKNDFSAEAVFALNQKFGYDDTK